MRRLTSSLVLTVSLLALTAPAAFAQASGEGLYGETNDKVVTNFGFIVIAFFPLFILLMSLLQWRLDKRKDAKKASIKARGGAQRWSGGW
ncbi:hypothetical protein [Conexibacter sp. SYSU D00693]|uniref:hypothetical protein n=1 Tax=Conexibacter sp. SYSU D00693 TaxID=2812560 RepID=UPI00196A8636|nr:hypothetical protein [Conexibacter sp. SYSU D00693]